MTSLYRTFAGFQRLENVQRALSKLQRAIGLAQSRPLSELEDQGVAGISGSRDAVREAVARQLLP